MTTIILTLGIGCVIGFSAGMFGIGGALLATPLLRMIIGLPEVIAVATPLPAAIPAAISGSVVYYRKRLIRFDAAWQVLPSAVLFSQVGALLTRQTSGPVLMLLTGGVLAYTAWVFIERGWNLKKRKDAPHHQVDPKRRLPVMILLGAMAGFVSGFLAIGGGMVLVPAFLRVVRMETKEAVATSLFCIATLAIPGTITHTLIGNIDWGVAGTLCVTVVPMSSFGAWVATRVHSTTLERIYGILMMSFAIYFTLLHAVRLLL